MIQLAFFSLLISPTICSFLLDMNMEINPIGNEEHASQQKNQPVGNCVDFSGEEKFTCWKSLEQWQNMANLLMPRQNSKTMTAKIARDFHRKYKNGEFSESIINRLHKRYTIRKYKSLLRPDKFGPATDSI